MTKRSLAILALFVGLTGSLHAIQNFNYILTFTTGAFSGTTVAISFDLTDGLATPAAPKEETDVSNFSVTVGTRTFTNANLTAATYINGQIGSSLTSGNISAYIPAASSPYVAPASFYINFSTKFGSINDSTQGGYSTAVGTLAQTTASVPDGGTTLALLGLALAGLAFVRRRIA